MTFYERAKALVAQMTLEEKTAQMRYDAPAIPRLGIPAYNWWNECLHGIARQGCATVFPQAIGMAASFDTELMFRVATAISDEARAKYNAYKKEFGDTCQYEGLTYWSPNINIFRDPRWGRGHETYGEDPYLTARMGTAFVKGLQGDGKYRKVDATLKHYAVHSGPERLRHSFDAKVNHKDLYETYLYAFRYIIDRADPSAVMGAYNRTNGEPCCGSKTLLQNILFDEFGFKGYVVSDCGAVCDFHEHHKITEDTAQSAALAVNSGCHLNCGKAYHWLGEALKRGFVKEETVTHAVEKLFEARFRLGMFDNDCAYDAIPFDVVNCDEHKKINRSMAQSSMVLLKNDGILPLKDTLTVAVIGPNADSKSALLGNYNGIPSDYSTLLNGIRNRCKGKVLYSVGSHIADDSSWAEENRLREAIIVAKKADVVVLCVGIDSKMEGEEGDTYSGVANDSGDKLSLDLPPIQNNLVRKIVETGKPVVYVNVSGSCMNLLYAKENCNAVLQCFYPGAQGGNAFADILFGDISPSGRLPVSFYRSLDDLPPFEDYSMENRTYKFFKGQCVYNFGDGLTYSDITENWTDANTCIVENTGNYDTAYSVLKYEYIPYKSLCGFKKIFIKCGEKVKVSFVE